jgi:putative ABC transport system permease protein
MFKHYLIIALRNLVNNKINSAIKIIGMGLGLAAVLTVIIVNYSELTWDSFWLDADQIYLVRSESRIGNRQEVWDTINENHYPQLRASLSDQLWMTKIESSNTELSIVRDAEPVAFPRPMAITQVDPDFFTIFQPHILSGDLNAFAQSPDVAAISQTVAVQIFGQENPLGKILQFRLQPTIEQQQSGKQTALQQVRIIAVVAIDNPRSHIRPAIFFPRLQNLSMPADQGAFMREVYVKAKHKMDSSHIEALLNKVSEASSSADEHENIYNRVKYSLMPITARHMNDSSSEGNSTRATILSLLGIIILIVAIGNFVSLGLAGYVARQKEVALRRMQGAGLWQLLFQYWLENLVYVAAAFLLALIICELAIPRLAGLLQFPLVNGIFVSPVLAIICAAMVLLVSLFIACYPALYFSRMNPAIILRANRSTETSASIITRKILLLVQFVALASLVIGLVAIHIQLKLINQYQPGYKTEGIVMFIGQGNTSLGKTQRETLKQELTKMPGFVAAASPMGDIPGRNEHTMEISAMVNDELREHRVIYDWIADADYFETYGIQLIAGVKENIITSLNKPFLREQSGSSFDVILCRATATALGFASPQEALGQTIEVFKQPGLPNTPSSKIIGVVENVHIGDHRKSPMDCMFMTLNTIGVGGMALAINFDHQLSALEIEGIKNLWTNAAGTAPHHWLFANSLADRYRNEQRLQLFMSGFALVALMIGLLGIYGITALNTQKRSREIALRKLHGAKQWQIIRLLNRDFSLMVIIANAIAWPMAIYAVKKWLENFHQHFSLVLWLPIFCTAALAISLLVVWLTVSLHTLSIGRLRPAEVLRDE